MRGIEQIMADAKRHEALLAAKIAREECRRCGLPRDQHLRVSVVDTRSEGNPIYVCETILYEPYE